MKSTLLIIALLLSSLSLALQLKKPASPLDRFMVPATLSELDYRRDKANVDMLRDTTAMRDGVGVPFIWDITDDHQHIIVRVFVSEKGLPKSFDERKEALSSVAWPAYGSVVSAFDLKFEDPRTPAMVAVQFMSIGDLVKDSSKAQPYAEFRNGQLTFH